MLGLNGRQVAKVVFTPPAKVLVKVGITPNWVTAIGTLATCGVALGLYPTGHLWLASVLLGALICTDALDGTMARLTGTTSKWGAFLDSTLDRVADAAIFGGLTIYLARQGDLWGTVAGVGCLALGAVVPYARAKAEALGLSAAIGLAERSDRLIVALVTAFITGLGAPRLVLVIGLGLLALASAITICQRAWVVYAQVKRASATPGQSQAP
ncbi:MAG: CDP-alcohol phosphatidyltransferase family protein [Micrococcales bacterium]|nr:CDP-alcohol phosphatidyltransferase family protein [Micrococcales bacterium]